MKKIVALALAGALAGACAASPDSIQPTYVSPLVYQNLSCQQLSMEMARVQQNVNRVTGQQQQQATNDAVAMGVGLVLFWPALFFLAGDDHADELGRLRGEYEALHQAGLTQNCYGAEAMTTAAATTSAGASQ